MASGTSVTITTDLAGLDDLLARVPREAQQVTSTWGKRCLDVSQARVPRRTGYLASTGLANTDHSATQAVGYVEYTAPYALAAEMGGGRRPGHHFLESSADSLAAGFLNECAGLLT